MYRGLIASFPFLSAFIRQRDDIYYPLDAIECKPLYPMVVKGLVFSEPHQKEGDGDGRPDNRKRVPSVTTPAGFGVHQMDGGGYGNEHAQRGQPADLGVENRTNAPEAQIAARNPEARPIRRSSKRSMLEKVRNAPAQTFIATQ